MTKPIRVLVADDHFVVRSGLVASLSLEKDIEIVAEAESGEQAVELCGRYRPTLVLLDLQMPDLNGIEVTQRLIRACPESRTLIFSTFARDEDIYQAVRAGALGYLPKTASRSELLTAIRTVAAGERYLPPALAQRLADRLAQPELSARELEILQLVRQGKSNKEIGAALFIAEDTVKRHVSHLLQKLRVQDRAQAVAEAIRRGLLPLE